MWRSRAPFEVGIIAIENDGVGDWEFQLQTGNLHVWAVTLCSYEPTATTNRVCVLYNGTSTSGDRKIEIRTLTVASGAQESSIWRALDDIGYVAFRGGVFVHLNAKCRAIIYHEGPGHRQILRSTA